MPELPEVETTRRGIAPHVEGRRVAAVTLRRPDLRWPIPREVAERLPGQRIDAVERRAKYLLLHTHAGSALLHLGMSGMLRVLPPDAPLGAHDHVDIAFDAEPGRPARVLRFTDPRRFGCLLWQPPGQTHELLAALGPEPLTDAFDGDLLWQLSRGRSAAIKLFLMDNAVVVGVGNIYASVALFAAGIDPRRAAGKVSRGRYARLAAEVKRILGHAIERGGTTLRDFLNPDGAPGYFFRELNVYGRAGEPCKLCGTPVRQTVQGQR
ncbi:bifunctional DNA-formamidopyrimidine glycosylase/DNA-(apurinic or apyrimidinic site) lyase, partial [Frateuria sp.]|uniref:bifunctional DNA-formamidopyrimidine glycosylase/DNA-(apurinic or apyrimidinic site) lyase n=1 Tax=Frateuria sp. TaxID=2211372 RepID=UPI0017B44F29